MKPPTLDSVRGSGPDHLHLRQQAKVLRLEVQFEPAALVAVGDIVYFDDTAFRVVEVADHATRKIAHLTSIPPEA